jgi:hypothetical protein
VNLGKSFKQFEAWLETRKASATPA